MYILVVMYLAHNCSATNFKHKGNKLIYPYIYARHFASVPSMLENRSKPLTVTALKTTKVAAAILNLGRKFKKIFIHTSHYLCAE